MNSQGIASSETYIHMTKRYVHTHIRNNSDFHLRHTDKQQIGTAGEILLSLQKERLVGTYPNTDEPQTMLARLKEEIFHDSIYMRQK